MRAKIGQRMRNNQIRLLLRGEANLHGRIRKARSDAQRVRQLLLEAAAWYSMATQPEQLPGERKPEVQKEWVTVQPKRRQTKSPTRTRDAGTACRLDDALSAGNCRCVSGDIHGCNGEA